MMSHYMIMKQAKVNVLEMVGLNIWFIFFTYAEDVMITLPPYSITYKHFAELCNGESINMEVRIVTFISMYLLTKNRHGFFMSNYRS